MSSEPRPGMTILDRFHELTEDDLSLLVQEGGPRELELLLHHPRLTEKQVLLFLRNKHVTDRMLGRIGGDRRFTKSYEVRHGLVLHPRTPRHLSLRFAKLLYLTHLVKLLDDHQVVPGVKRHCESLLLQRLPQITLGERIAMARTGGRGVIQVLRTESEILVLRPLLANPKTTSADVTHIIACPRVPVEIFHDISASRRWSQVYQVRLALASNPRVPAGVALGNLTALMTKDLTDIAENEVLPRLIRLSAERVLEARSGPEERESPPSPEAAMGVS